MVRPKPEPIHDPGWINSTRPADAPIYHGDRRLNFNEDANQRLLDMLDTRRADREQELKP